MDRAKILEELGPFCDIGDTPKITEKDGKFTLRMNRDGRPLKVIIDGGSQKVQTTWGVTTPRSHSSIAAMLSSEIFSNLKRWSETQYDLLKSISVTAKKLIPINGKTHDNRHISNVEETSALLNYLPRNQNSTEILLIDGAAGIGKTNLIEQLALLRSENYKTSLAPLILHVKSRGRVLSNIQDLMAFSLQTIRSNITYDQLPILVRYGLVIVAIDGFDELGDPNGYELAWTQLGELINFVRGNGTIILSGRDTFMGRERLMNDVKEIKKDIDVVTGLTLDSPNPDQARTYLRTCQWSDSDFSLPAVSVLLEEGSFAMRPVFLRLLGDVIKPKQLREKTENYLTSMLVTHMVEREAKLFGKAVDAVISPDKMEKFLMAFVREAARDMADSQTESLDESTFSWIAEAALEEGYPQEVIGLIKNRANVVGFLIPDERARYRKFINSQLMNFFLAQTTIDLVLKLELPKYLRRNLLGSEYLSIFIDVIAEEGASPESRMSKFIENAVWLAQNHSYVDRGIRNLGALLFASLPYFSMAEDAVLEDFEIDEALIRGTASAVSIKDVMISQLDSRGGDLGLLKFTNVSIVNLIANNSSRFPESFPNPKFITEGDGKQISDPKEIEEWLNARGRNHSETLSQGLASVAVSRHPVYKLLGRACRIRQYWLRAEDDIYGERVLKDKDWPLLRNILVKNDLLREEVRQASGRPSAFYHIRMRDRILAENHNDVEIAKFFSDLSASI
ncbi:hypothetical protein [Duganella sp. S19_KUP01_CR8]|uniref:hypothetical protein n=1 Tax=Duganella sp. S19_KUP01_CR8 TaxID=3025502 RepID=UPI002FCD7240